MYILCVIFTGIHLCLDTTLLGGPPLNCLISETVLYLKLSYNEPSYEEVSVYIDIIDSYLIIHDADSKDPS